MAILITEQKVKEYFDNPIRLAYDSGHSQGWSDRSWDPKIPRVFTKDDCPSYRQGYRAGWAAASSFYKNEEGEHDDSISDEQRCYWVEEELSIIRDWETRNAECDDEHCVSDDEAKRSWMEVIECMLRTIEKPCA